MPNVGKCPNLGLHQAYSEVCPSIDHVVSYSEPAFLRTKTEDTGLPVVPAVLLRLVNSPEWEKTDTSSIDATGSGAGVLPAALLAKFKSKVDSNFLQGMASEAVRPQHNSHHPLRNGFAYQRTPPGLRDHWNDSRECNSRI